MKLPMHEHDPGPYIPIFAFDEFCRRIMVSFGYAAGYEGEPPEKNPGTSHDERAWWDEGWLRGAAIFETFQVTKPAPVSAPVATPAAQPVVGKSRNLF